MRKFGGTSQDGGSTQGRAAAHGTAEATSVAAGSGGAGRGRAGIFAAVARRMTRRATLLAGTMGLLVFFGSAQAASAWILKTVSPEHGCPSETITFTGEHFGAKGSTTTVNWIDPTAQQPSGDNLGEEVSTVGTVTVENTTATAIVPVFLQVQGSGVGSVEIGGSSYKTFTFTELQNCFRAEKGPKARREQLARPAKKAPPAKKA